MRTKRQELSPAFNTTIARTAMCVDVMGGLKTHNRTQYTIFYLNNQENNGIKTSNAESGLHKRRFYSEKHPIKQHKTMYPR